MGQILAEGLASDKFAFSVKMMVCLFIVPVPLKAGHSRPRKFDASASISKTLDSRISRPSPDAIWIGIKRDGGRRTKQGSEKKRPDRVFSPSGQFETY
jgi:predicted amidophosphoribosyltransferase